MTAVAYVPPNVMPPLLQKFAPLLKRKWFRELVLLPPTLSRRRFSNKTEDYGVFKPSRIATSGSCRSMCRTSSARAAGTNSWAAFATAAPASKSRIRSSRAGPSAAAI